MKERPILFSGEMVRAILDGRKTQTRRIVKNTGFYCIDKRFHSKETVARELAALATQCPYGKVGDRLRVKEAAWMWCEKQPNGLTPTGRLKFKYVPLRSAMPVYCASHPEMPLWLPTKADGTHASTPLTGNGWLWRKKIGRYLPAWASRIALEVVSVRVERLQDITEADAIEEGTSMPDSVVNDDNVHGSEAWVEAYRLLWEFINGPGSWEKNPWVWVVEFKRAKEGK